jgi:type IV pilus assembly protein PilE
VNCLRELPVSRTRRVQGVTLLEVVVVVAILGILLSLALPSYQRYLQRGHRAEAIRHLLEIVACQERVRSTRGHFDTSRCLHGAPNDRYRYTLEPADKTSTLNFTAIATPVIDDNDACGVLTLDQSGSRGIGGDTEMLGRCWGGR